MTDVRYGKCERGGIYGISVKLIVHRVQTSARDFLYTFVGELCVTAIIAGMRCIVVGVSVCATAAVTVAIYQLPERMLACLSICQNARFLF